MCQPSQYSCALPFTYSPQPGAPSLLQAANQFNTTYDSAGYANGAMCCNNAGVINQLPTWPPRGSSRIWPVIDCTQDSYPLFANHLPGGDINSWTDNLTGQTTSDIGRWVPNPSGILAVQAMNPNPPQTGAHNPLAAYVPRGLGCSAVGQYNPMRGSFPLLPNTAF